MGSNYSQVESDGSYEFYNESFHVARKTYKCSESGLIIRPGDRYKRISGKFDGRVFCYKVHQAIVDFVERWNLNGCHHLTELKDFINDLKHHEPESQVLNDYYEIIKPTNF